VVLLDWDLPDREADTLKTLVQTVAGRPIVIISPPQPPDVIMAALQSGVRGCLSYNLTSEDFVDRLRLLAGGDLFISGDISHGLEAQFSAAESADTQDALSDREREVLSLVAYGSTNREIAEKLIVTENTVKVHLRHILEKLDLRNRQQAAAYAVRSGLVENQEPPDNDQSGV
jgi:DNA-binding NarL/FixJ family response regulator